ncbi:hypothetical protein Pmani_006358 [Petrolisthes manimaculis]|uniref:Uncharacterized protein n=1 Tax=Petrolisthes manimaculis TaxID=1843537 RepID=A0AAE1ULX8_9EUCA|nr:hypothetical protein Pmani_006358 [Petrolisthes manimaculis]
MAYNDKEEENLALRRTNKITEEENIILKEDDKQLINQIRSLEDRMDNLKVQLKKEIIEEIYEEFEEREMKEKKKNNLIIFNIEETEYPSRQEKIQKELDTCIQVFKEIQSEVKDEDIVETFRIEDTLNNYVAELEDKLGTSTVNEIEAFENLIKQV